MHPHRRLLLSLVCCACATTTGDHDDDIDRTATRKVDSPACEAFVGEIEDPARTSAMYRELLAATGPGDPAVPEVLVGLARSDLADRRVESACRALAIASEADDDAIADTATAGQQACCDEIVAATPTAASAAALGHCAPDDASCDGARTAASCGDDHEAACEVRGIVGCCTRAAIKHEYEMLEAQARGDEAAAQHHERRLRGLSQRACDGGVEDGCAWLRQHAE